MNWCHDWNTSRWKGKTWTWRKKLTISSFRPQDELKFKNRMHSHSLMLQFRAHLMNQLIILTMLSFWCMSDFTMQRGKTSEDIISFNAHQRGGYISGHKRNANTAGPFGTSFIDFVVFRYIVAYKIMYLHFKLSDTSLFFTCSSPSNLII